MTHTRMIASISCACAVTLIVFFTISGVRSQESPLPSRVELQHQVSDPNLRLEPYDAALHADFASIFQRPEWAPTGQYAVVVTNDTDLAIEGLVVRWSASDGRAGLTWNTLQLDSYSNREGDPIVLPHSSAIVTPSGVIQKEVVATRFMTTAMLAPPAHSRMEGQGRTIVVVDSILLGDGRVLGADEIGISNELMVRQRAASLLLDQLSKAGNDPEAIAQTVSAIADVTMSANTDETTRWLVTLARQLRRSPESMARLTRLAAAKIPRQ